MAIRTFEDYRIAILSKGLRYKCLGHSVREDETLQVRFRSRLLPRSLFCGELATSPGKISGIVRTATRELSEVKAIHYHPSGRINLKGSNGAPVKILRGMPLQMLKAPFPVCSLSPAFIEQLEIDRGKASSGDYEFNLDEMSLGRIQVELWVGPKECFKNTELIRPGVRIVYDDAALYDIAYFIGEAPSIADDIQVDGIKLASTCIRQFPTDITGEQLKEIPDISSVIWSSPPAVARQVRAFLEHHVECFRSRIGSQAGGYEVRISLCADGVVAAVDWGASFQYSFLRHENLRRGDVLGVLGWKPTVGGKIRDVAEIAPELTGNVSGTVFVRVKPRRSLLHNAIVFNAIDPPSGARPYWRVPPRALQQPAKIIDLIAPKIG